MVELWVGRLDKAFVYGAGTVSVICLLVIGVVLFVSVILRYAAGSSLPFATELPTFLFPWLICGGIVAAAGAGGHLAVDFFVERLPTAVRRWLRTAMWLLIAIALVFVAWAALGLVQTFSGVSTPILGWPAGLSYVAFPVALVCLVVHAVGRVAAAFFALPGSAGLVADTMTEQIVTPGRVDTEEPVA